MSNFSPEPIHVIGGGLAGSEAAWQISRSGLPVVVHEMRPMRPTEAHKTAYFAELVCSNSFRSDDALSNAVGVIHREMRRMGSLIMACADRHQVPAGGALAVDRDGFAAAVTSAIASEPLIEVRREVVDGLPPDHWTEVILATGPLTSPGLATAIAALAGEEHLAFFDAIAPIVYRDSIDFDKAWFQSRYDKVGPGGNGLDYINCPLDHARYDAFVDALLTREDDLVQGMGGHALFQRLPSHRSHGRTGTRNVAAWSHEARWTDEPARADRETPRHRPIATG